MVGQVTVAGVDPCHEIAQAYGRMGVVGQSVGETPPQVPLPGLISMSRLGQGVPALTPVPGLNHLRSKIQILVEAVGHIARQRLPCPGVCARCPQARDIAFLDHGCQQWYQSPRQALRAPGGMDRVQTHQLGHVFDEGAGKEKRHAHGYPMMPGQRGLGAVHQGKRRHQHGHHHAGSTPRPTQRVDQIVDEQGCVRRVFEFQGHGLGQLG